MESRKPQPLSRGRDTKGRGAQNSFSRTLKALSPVTFRRERTRLRRSAVGARARHSAARSFLAFG